MIRKATKEDINIINSFNTKVLLNKLKYENPGLDIVSNDFWDELDDNNYIILLAEEDDKTVGYLHGYKDDNKAILDSIYVEDDYRNNSIGEELMNELQKWSIINSLKTIEVSIDNGNDAYFLFDKLGYEIRKVTMNLDV